MAHLCIARVSYINPSSFGRLVLAFALILSIANGAAFAQTIQGVPWTGAHGVTESVGTIMSRQKASPGQGPGQNPGQGQGPGQNGVQIKPRGGAPAGRQD